MNASVNARTFKSGNSEAVRLPKGLGFGIGTEVRIERNGDRVVLIAVRDEAAAKARWLKMLDELKALPKPPYIEKREPVEFPDRPGL
jgi:antitoxin VapB